jgi:hypothetical protein
LNICTHNSLLQIIIVPSLISTLYSSLVTHTLVFSVLQSLLVVYTLQFTCYTHSSVLSLTVSTSRFPVMDLSNRDSCASVLTSLLSSEYPTTELLLQTVMVVTSRHGPCRKHRFQQFLYCCAWTRCHENLFISRLLPGNGCTRYSIVSISQAFAVSLYAVYLFCNYNQFIQLSFNNFN